MRNFIARLLALFIVRRPYITTEQVHAVLRRMAAADHCGIEPDEMGFGLLTGQHWD